MKWFWKLSKEARREAFNKENVIGMLILYGIVGILSYFSGYSPIVILEFIVVGFCIFALGTILILTVINKIK